MILSKNSFQIETPAGKIDLEISEMTTADPVTLKSISRFVATARPRRLKVSESGENLELAYERGIKVASNRL